MKKTIVIKKDTINGKTEILDEIMKGALRFRYGITKETVVFDSKKEAQEHLSNHPCRKGLKFLTLNNKQLKYVNIIKTAKERYFMKSEIFMSLED